MRFSLKKRHKSKFDSDSSISIDEQCRRILTGKSPFAVAESYRSARTNLQFMPKEGDCQKIVITSPYPDSGKSLNSANLSIALAMNGYRVLLMDCDLRKSHRYNLFDLPKSSGLTEYLAGITDHATLFKHPDYETLSILLAGAVPPNPTEMLSSTRMSNLLDQLSKQFDYIIIDTPPINVVTDAAVFANKVNGYVMVVRAGRTKKDELNQALSALEQVDANVFGFLLNDVDAKSSGYGKYGKYGRYARYGARSQYGYYGRDAYGEGYGD